MSHITRVNPCQICKSYEENTSKALNLDILDTPKMIAELCRYAVINNALPLEIEDGGEIVSTALEMGIDLNAFIWSKCLHNDSKLHVFYAPNISADVREECKRTPQDGKESDYEKNKQLICPGCSKIAQNGKDFCEDCEREYTICHVCGVNSIQNAHNTCHECEHVLDELVMEFY